METTTRRALRPAKAADKLGIGVSTLWAKVKNDPTFPRPIKLSPRTTIFREEELDAYLDTCPRSVGKSAA